MDMEDLSLLTRGLLLKVAKGRTPISGPALHGYLVAKAYAGGGSIWRMRVVRVPRF